MTTTPRHFSPPAAPGTAQAAPSPASSVASALNIRWLALHDAAAPVARLAGLAPAPMGPAERMFPAALRELGGWRRALAEQGIDDLSAVLQSGIVALLAVHARGAAPTAAARALWDEFLSARAGLLGLAADGDAELR